MILLHLLFPRMAVVHIEALCTFYADGILMLPDAFIATFTGKHRPKDKSGSLDADASNVWRGRDDLLRRAIEHPTNRAKVIRQSKPVTTPTSVREWCDSLLLAIVHAVQFEHSRCAGISFAGRMLRHCWDSVGNFHGCLR